MDTETIGRFIAARRKVRGLTQQQLADELGLTNKQSQSGKRDRECRMLRRYRYLPRSWE